MLRSYAKFDTMKSNLTIIGAGLAGASLAVALAPLGLEITLLEKRLANLKPDPTAPSRPISLAYSSQVILNTLGVWPALAPQACPIKAVHVSQQSRFGAVHISAVQQQVDALGYVVPLAQLQLSLYHTLCKYKNVRVIEIDALENIQLENQQATIHYHANAQSHTLQTELCVAADGTQSEVREQIGIAYTEHNTGDYALTCTLHLQQAHQHVAYERFTSQGILALLPMPQSHQVRLVWTFTGAQQKKISEWSDATLLNFIQHCFGSRLGAITKLERQKCFPLQTRIANEQVREALVLIGNSAHTIYPLAAQGFNLTLRDIAVLAQVIDDAWQAQQPIGNMSVLTHYVNWREPDQKRVIRLTRVLEQGFDLQLPLLSHARSLGLLAMDLLMPCKKRLASTAMGMTGKLPKLARGIALGVSYEQ